MKNPPDVVILPAMKTNRTSLLSLRRYIAVGGGVRWRAEAVPYQHFLRMTYFYWRPDFETFFREKYPDAPEEEAREQIFWADFSLRGNLQKTRVFAVLPEVAKNPTFMAGAFAAIGMQYARQLQDAGMKVREAEEQGCDLAGEAFTYFIYFLMAQRAVISQHYHIEVPFWSVKHLRERQKNLTPHCLLDAPRLPDDKPVTPFAQMEMLARIEPLPDVNVIIYVAKNFADFRYMYEKLAGSTMDSATRGVIFYDEERRPDVAYILHFQQEVEANPGVVLHEFMHLGCRVAQAMQCAGKNDLSIAYSKAVQLAAEGTARFFRMYNQVLAGDVPNEETPSGGEVPVASSAADGPSGT